ncbi:Hint domain-containing protein [Rhodobacter sp. NTK016B]|uniref:Hint domain-containing protein n=1 Tax=Rhodobacter sp. NTK016B TaxID=2759676 RepID=UPI001A8EE32D|nr:Hint domain-containing protein [Rhodobacter sp. NTK016B]MBN8292731.1 Hint domain-containing protein [Rhodobacter sp. NTK016B]
MPKHLIDRKNAAHGQPPARTVPGTRVVRDEALALAGGLIAGTRVATDMGWLPVEELRAGDRVATFDNGMRPVRAVHVSSLHTDVAGAPRGVWPLALPAGALGNRSALRVLPGQPILIESDAAETLYGDAFTLVSAAVLDGHNGIAPVEPESEISIVTLEFDGDEVIYVDGTLLAQCGADGARHDNYPRLSEAQGRQLIATMPSAHHPQG